MIRVRQTIPHVIMDTDGVKPSPFPAKVFTTRYPVVKYPYSVTKNKAYSYFGLAVEEEVALALKTVYKNKFVGEVAHESTIEKRFPYLSAKDIATYIPLLNDYIKEVVEYFLHWYPPSAISRVTYQHELTLGTLGTEGAPSVTGHPDIIVWLDDTNVVIYDIKVFARTNVNINKEIRLQICSYAALARSMGLGCDYIGVIMPWCRSGSSVRDFSIEKWKEKSLILALEKAGPKVLMEEYHYLKWSFLLTKYGVGSHVHSKTAMDISLAEPPIQIPFQIFLYGNNPSAAMETKNRDILMASSRTRPNFSRNNIFIHAPYNITLCSPASYIVESIKLYIEDAYILGAKGVVFHTGHHADEAEGLKIMKRNMDAVLKYIHYQTPLIIETPCGNKNEMLNTPSKFSQFIMSYPEHLVGICIDTCHVYVSGKTPTEYVSELKGDSDDLQTSALDRVCLIHFNGSRKKLGCCADGHAHVTGINNIEDSELEGILSLASELGIPCVTE